MKKKFFIIVFVLLMFLIFFIFIFSKSEYKSKISGNNISKSDNIDILNMSSYEAIVMVEVHSNKNINKYVMKQKYLSSNVFYQEVIEPSNLKGLKIVYDGTNTVLENSLLSIKKVYENFQGDVSNLSLIGFASEYKEGTESYTEETSDELIMKTKISKSKNKYQMYENLYISKNSNLPTKMEILDINKNITVYILYNEIKINQTSNENILGV